MSAWVNQEKEGQLGDHQYHSKMRGSKNLTKVAAESREPWKEKG